MIGFISFLVIFFVMLIPVGVGMNIIYSGTKWNLSEKYDKIPRFILSHMCLILFLSNTNVGIWWFSLTITHGMAHLIHPAFYKIEPNKNYTPLYDYIVHAMQCLMIHYVMPEYLWIGITLAVLMLLSGMYAHCDKTFLNTYVWILVSSIGVFGTFMHMMLLGGFADSNIIYAGIVIWTLPYIGYLNDKKIAQWDYLMNRIGLFEYWYLNYLLTFILYSQLHNL